MRITEQRGAVVEEIRQRGATLKTFDEPRKYLGSALRRLELQAVHLRRSLAKVEAGGFGSLTRWSASTSSKCSPLGSRAYKELLIGPFRTVAILDLEDQIADRLPDLLNLIEKSGIIDSAGDWVKMRELRNAIAHEYWDNEQERDELFGRVVV